MTENDKTNRPERTRRRISWKQLLNEAGVDACRCPNCNAPGKVHSRVLNTYVIGTGHLVRKRLCSVCGNEWATTENNLE